MVAWLALTVTGLLAQPARAGAAGVERPTLPSMSTVADDGALSMWSNPANLGFDPDPSFGLIYAQPFGGDADALQQSTLAMAGNLGPLGTGFAYTGGANEPAWWTLSTSLGIRTARTVSMGAHFG